MDDQRRMNRSFTAKPKVDEPIVHRTIKGGWTYCSLHNEKPGNLSFHAQRITHGPAVRGETKEETEPSPTKPPTLKEAEVVGGVVVRAPECWQASIMNPYVVFTMITGERKAEMKKTKWARGMRRKQATSSGRDEGNKEEAPWERTTLAWFLFAARLDAGATPPSARLTPG